MAYDPVRFLVVRDFLNFKKTNQWAEQAPEQLTKNIDRRFYFHLLQGMIRHQRLLEEEIRSRIKKPFHKLQDSVVGILSLGIFQLYFMDKVPARAGIFETVELAVPFRIFQQKGLINAVLRNLQRDPDKKSRLLNYPLPVRTSHQDWMVARWQNSYSKSEVQSICEANNVFEGITIRTKKPWNRAQLQKKLRAEGVESRLHPIADQALIVENASECFRTNAFHEGAFYVQDSSSQVFLELTESLWKGDVLDACAAPGGKSLQILESSQLRHLVINDISRNRLLKISQNIARLNLNSQMLTISDSRRLPYLKPFDVILLDVPCSATGTIRKNPDLKWTAQPATLLKQEDLQRRLLEHSVLHLKPGGTLVYSTCSLETEENDLQIKQFLENHPEFELLPFFQLPNVPQNYSPYLTKEGYFRSLPSPEMMGFFAAVLLHRGERTENNFA
ncbi:MAG: 16S rRNA (cytosine(967)-C(5))-methyltransferase RsmB [SAR324 cluster bacterium]|nr:16S rRNA (cytosine(967)-C(5))-methyltransferase RsmB [SAR324 cluster bacterium]